MEWGSIVLAVQILLLVAGWLLFQQAKSELTARAAQIPVLSEVKALQKSIAMLLEQLKLESAQMSGQLEARCLEARELLSALERRLEEAERVTARAPLRRRGKTADSESAHHPPAHLAEPRPKREGEPTEPPRSSEMAAASRYAEVFALADQGVSPAVIAQRTGVSEGEVELVLGLRTQVPTE